jgi:pseudaminic acid cytidylyltransferase
LNKVAIIPARGGSKRIKHKNIKFFCGKEMIAWSIEAALESGCFDRIIVSTDDETIVKVANKYGVEAPFVRPADISDDFSTTSEVIAHSIQWLNDNELMPDLVCCIYATAPFITPKDIVSGLELLIKKQGEFVFPVTSFPFPIQRALKIENDGSINMYQPDNYLTRSQDLTPAYHDAGQFYWGSANAWLQKKSIFTNSKSFPLLLPSYRVQDIDTVEDWVRAEIMHKTINLDNY